MKKRMRLVRSGEFHLGIEVLVIAIPCLVSLPERKSYPSFFYVDWLKPIASFEMELKCRPKTSKNSQSAPIRQEADSKLRLLEEGGSSAKSLVQPEQ